LDRLYNDSFQDIIKKLLNQKLKPKYIIIKVEIDTEAYIIQNNDYPSLIIHCYNSIYKDFNIDTKEELSVASKTEFQKSISSVEKTNNIFLKF
jgi:hypothetical protein